MDREVTNWKVTFWTIFFSVLSLILFNLALFFPEQRFVILISFIVSVIAALIFFYVSKINYNEKLLRDIRNDINDLMQRFNYLKELQDMKMDIEMLKRKRGEIELLDLLKVLIAGVLIYIIIEIIKSAV